MGGSQGRFHTHPPSPERARLSPIRMGKCPEMPETGPTNQLHHPQEQPIDRRSRSTLHKQTQMALVNGRSKLAKILAEKGRWRRSPVTAHQDSLAETGKLRTLRECIESIVFVQYGALRPRQTITMPTGRSGAATTS